MHILRLYTATVYRFTSIRSPIKVDLHLQDRRRDRRTERWTGWFLYTLSNLCLLGGIHSKVVFITYFVFCITSSSHSNFCKKTTKIYDKNNSWFMIYCSLYYKNTPLYETTTIYVEKNGSYISNVSNSWTTYIIPQLGLHM